MPSSTKHYRLLNKDKGIKLGDFPTLEEAWEAVREHKGKLVLWEQAETSVGWRWTQQPLRYYSLKEKLLFNLKGYWSSLQTWYKRLRS